MRFIIIFLILIFLHNCSFDNKSGIWNNENEITKIDKEFNKYEDLISSNESYKWLVRLRKRLCFWEDS